MLSESAQGFRLVGTWRIHTLLRRRKHKERIRLRTEVEVLGERTTDEERGVTFHLKEVVLLFPDEGDALKFTEGVPLGLRRHLTCLPLRQHEVEDELLPPQDDALDHIEGKHAQAVQNIDALFKQGHVRLVFTRMGLLYDSAQFYNLREAGFSGDDGSDRALDGRLFTLEIFDFFDNDRAILLG